MDVQSGLVSALPTGMQKRLPRLKSIGNVAVVLHRCCSGLFSRSKIKVSHLWELMRTDERVQYISHFPFAVNG